MEGKAFGRYRVTSKLAKGSMGAVYTAVHELMGLDAAVKVLSPELSRDPSKVERLFAEAQAAARIRHPGIVSIFDLGYANDECAYIAMELLHGAPLQERLRRAEPMSIETVVTIMRQLAATLDAAHEGGIVHRRLNPANVFLVPDPDAPGGERVKVLGLGMARLADWQGVGPGFMRTCKGELLGMPAYMAPEQCADAADVDHRADLYALGCLLYACLCGQPPFTGAGADVLAAHLRAEPTPPRGLRSDVPPHLNTLAMRLLAKRPGDRPDSCTEVIEMLDRHSPDQGGRAAQDDDAPLTDAQTAVPEFAETEMCEVIEEHDQNVSVHAHRGLRRTLRGLPIHYRPPGPSRSRQSREPHYLPGAPEPHGTKEPARAAAAGEPASAPARCNHKTTPGTRRARTNGDGDWNEREPVATAQAANETAGQEASETASRTDEYQDSLTTITTSAAQIYRQERGEPRRRHLWASVTALAALAGLVYGLVAVSNGGRLEPDPHDEPRAAARPTLAPSVVDVQRDLIEMGAATDPDDAASAPAHAQGLDEVQAAMDREQWDRALALARQAQAASTDAGLLAQAAELETHARRERSSLAAFEQLREAAATGDMTVASTRLGEIPETSMYHAPAVELMREVWLTAQTRQARELMVAGRCDELDRITEEIAYVSQDASIPVAEMHASCIQANAEAGGDAGAAARTPRAGASQEALEQALIRAYHAKRYRKAHRLCRKALAALDGDAQAGEEARRLVALCGMTACRLKRASLARRYHDQASGNQKQQIGAACAREGIDLTRR